LRRRPPLYALLLWLRPQRLWLLRVARAGRPLHFRLTTRLRLDLRLSRHAPLLLSRNHLLPRSLALDLLLLPQRFSLVLLLLHLLAHALALHLLRISTLDTLLFELLPAQILHLLPRISIAAGNLSRQIRHLSFPCLICGQVRLWTLRRTGLSASLTSLTLI
jgi:hypothetical protein